MMFCYLEDKGPKFLTIEVMEPVVYNFIIMKIHTVPSCLQKFSSFIDVHQSEIKIEIFCKLPALRFNCVFVHPVKSMKNEIRKTSTKKVAYNYLKNVNQKINNQISDTCKIKTQHAKTISTNVYIYIKFSNFFTKPKKTLAYQNYGQNTDLEQLKLNPHNGFRFS